VLLRVWQQKTISRVAIKKHPNTMTCLQSLILCYQAANIEKDFVEWLKERLNEKKWAALLELIEL